MVKLVLLIVHILYVALMNQKHEREFADLNRKLSEQEEELTENSQKMYTLQVC